MQKKGMTGGKPRRHANAKYPTWVRAVPESQAHGSGTLQKRLWKLTSDYVRIRDWYEYGTCVATGNKIRHWTDGQAGHLIAYSTCNGMFKFSLRNIHMQSARSNAFGSYSDFKRFEQELRNRGIYVEELELANKALMRTKPTDTDVLAQMLMVIRLMAELPEQPEYYVRVVTLLNDES